MQKSEKLNMLNMCTNTDTRWHEGHRKGLEWQLL